MLSYATRFETLNANENQLAQALNGNMAMNWGSGKRNASGRASIRFRFIISLLPVFGLMGDGCRVAKETATLPVKAVTAVVPGKKTAPTDPAVLQTEVLRYADDFSSRMGAGIDDYINRVNTPEARDQGLRWKIAQESSALGIATGPNPTANLLDFLALATLTREFLEERAADSVPRDAFDSWLATSRSAETNAWKLAESVLEPEQLAEFRTAIEEWRKSADKSNNMFFERPQKIASLIRETGEKKKEAGSVFSLVGLDPTAGLDPAVREVTRTRLFAERAMFATLRMPFLIRWQTELFTEQLFRQEQLGAAVASADRLSHAADSLSQTAALLPDRIASERKAILDAFDAQEGRLRDLSAEVTRTLGAGEKMSTSLNSTIVSFDALMKRFSVGEPSASPPDTNGPAFSILDYAHTADRVAAMAQQLDVLIKDTSGTVDTPALDKKIAQLNALSARARADALSVLNHAFFLAAGLIVLSFVCAFLYRRLAPPATISPPTPLPDYADRKTGQPGG
jgi:hypothetical protein